MITISTSFDGDRDVFYLVARHPGMSDAPAGPRLFRAPPYPDVKFEHDSPAAARTDAAKLQAYLAAQEPSKRK